jgi:hypothetical protein
MAELQQSLNRYLFYCWQFASQLIQRIKDTDCSDDLWKRETAIGNYISVFIR